MRFPALLLATALFAAPASAQEMDYAPGALGYAALKAGDLSTAERQLRTSPADANDPARLINLGQVFARQGRHAEAADLFRRAKTLEDSELVLADGAVMSSREAARRALRAIPDVRFSSR